MIQMWRGAAIAATSASSERAPVGAFGFERRDRRLAHVVDDALVAVGHQPLDHVGAHPPESDHRHLHRRSLPDPALVVLTGTRGGRLLDTALG